MHFNDNTDVKSGGFFPPQASCVLWVIHYMHAEVYSSRVPELCAVFTQTVMTAREREEEGRTGGRYAREKERESENDKLFQKDTHEPSDWTWDVSQLNAGPCGFAKKRHVGLNPMHFWNVEVIDQPSALWKCPLRPRSDLPPPSPSVFGVGSLCLSVNNMDIKGRKWKESRWVTGLSVAPLPL